MITVRYERATSEATGKKYTILHVFAELRDDAYGDARFPTIESLLACLHGTLLSEFVGITEQYKRLKSPAVFVLNVIVLEDWDGNEMTETIASYQVNFSYVIPYFKSDLFKDEKGWRRLFSERMFAQTIVEWIEPQLKGNIR